MVIEITDQSTVFARKTFQESGHSKTFEVTLSAEEVADLEIMWDYPIWFNLEVDERLIPANAQRVSISADGEIIVIK